MFRHLDLFSGIGGFSLAAKWVLGANHEVVAFCEHDWFCQKVLKKHWPGVPIIKDIKALKIQKTIKKSIGYDYGRIDLITGGFPCQPFSCAGKRRGKEDDRYLWPEMLRVIQETLPTFVIGENVTAIRTMVLEDVCSDMENSGYEVQPIIIPACAVGCEFIGDRVWILGKAKGIRFPEGKVGKRNVFKGNLREPCSFLEYSILEKNWEVSPTRGFGIGDGLYPEHWTSIE